MLPAFPPTPAPAIALVCLTALALLLLAAALSDLRRRHIANGLCRAVALLALPYWLALDPSLARLAVQMLCALVVGLLLLTAFRFDLLGGGDVKLMTALALWLPPFLLYQTILMVAIGGGLLAIAVLLFNRRRLACPSVPYGVAIAIAGLVQITLRVAALIG